MNMTQKIRKFQDQIGIDQAGMAKIDHQDLMGIVNPKRMNEPVFGPGVPINHGLANRALRADQEFTAADREVMKQLGLSEDDYRKYLDGPVAEKSPAPAAELQLTDKEKIDKALGLSAQDYIDFG